MQELDRAFVGSGDLASRVASAFGSVDTRQEEVLMKRTILTIAAVLTALVLGSGVALAATIVGTNGDDTRNGTVNRDVMYGLGGKDTLNGREGNDEIDGGAGNDPNLTGSTGNDEVSGGSGLDSLRGNDGNDILYGGNGADDISAGTATAFAQNEMYGGPGADTINAQSPAAFDEVYGGSGNDVIDAEDDRLDYIDCGVYSSPGNAADDTDMVNADRTADGDSIDDVLYECEIVN
jgi:Ca2+-binding RTX toxin-like protein